MWLLQQLWTNLHIYRLKKGWDSGWAWAGAFSHCSKLQCGYKASSNADWSSSCGHKPASSKAKSCCWGGMQSTALRWSSLDPFSQTFIQGMFLFIQLTHLHLLLWFFISQKLAKQFFGLWALAQYSLPPDWDSSPVLQWVTPALTPPLFSFSLVHGEICETQKDKSPPMNCWASADTSCHATDRMTFTITKPHNEEFRRLLELEKRHLLSWESSGNFPQGTKFTLLSFSWAKSLLFWSKHDFQKGIQCWFGIVLLPLRSLFYGLISLAVLII